jgi:hypothetical protein
MHKKIYYLAIENNEKLGEMDSFWSIENSQLIPLAYWYCWDALFSMEYMGGLFTNLGVEIVDLPPRYKRKAISLITKLEKEKGNI